MIRFEWLKLRRSRRPLFAVAALVVFLVLMLVGFYLYARSRRGDDFEFRYTFENDDYFNGLTFTVYAFYFGVLLVVPIFLATEGGSQIAGETGPGTLRLLLTRPVSKSRLFLSKLAAASTYSAVLVGGFLGASLGVGLVAIGWGDLDLYPGVLQLTDTHQHLELRTALARFALIWPAACVAMLAPLSFSLLLSAWMRSAVNAAGASVSLYLVLHVVSGVPFFEDLRPYLFTTYVGYWRELLQEDVDWLRLGEDAAKLLSFSLLFLGLGHRRFRRREEG